MGLLDPVERMIQQSKCRPLEMDAILVLNGFTERGESPFLENGQNQISFTFTFDSGNCSVARKSIAFPTVKDG